MAFAGSNIWNEILKEVIIVQTLHSFKEHPKKRSWWHVWPFGLCWWAL